MEFIPSLLPALLELLACTACLSGEGRLFLFCGSDLSGLLFLNMWKYYIRKDLEKTGSTKLVLFEVKAVISHLQTNELYFTIS